MRIAEVLSDLTSLRVGDPNAALALVSARPPAHASDSSAVRNLVHASDSKEGDANLLRAQDLLDLHANVKVAHGNGIDRELLQARDSVRKALGNGL